MTFKSGLLDPKFFREVMAVHVAGHDEVGEQQIDFVFVLVPDFERFGAAGGLQNLVAVFLEDAGDEFAHGFFVLDEQDGFGAAANR